MSGSDRTLTKAAGNRQQARETPAASDLLPAAKKLDTQDARLIKLTRALAVAALGAERVLKAERLRAKGWSVRGIASQVASTEAAIRALFGEGGPL